MIPYMVGKLAPNLSHFTRGLAKYVPGRGYFRAIPSQNRDKYVTSPTPPQSLNWSAVPVNVHCIEGISIFEGPEEVNGDRNGNEDGNEGRSGSVNGVGGGNGDGNGVGMRIGVGARERRQAGNGDESGDGEAAGAELRGQTQDGSGDGSGDGNNDSGGDGNVNGSGDGVGNGEENDNEEGKGKEKIFGIHHIREEVE